MELPQLSSLAVFHAALQQGIRISPARVSTVARRVDHCLRLNAGLPTPREVDRAMHTLVQAIEYTLNLRRPGAERPPTSIHAMRARPRGRPAGPGCGRAAGDRRPVLRGAARSASSYYVSEVPRVGNQVQVTRAAGARRQPGRRPPRGRICALRAFFFTAAPATGHAGCAGAGVQLNVDVQSAPGFTQQSE